MPNGPLHWRRRVSGAVKWKRWLGSIVFTKAPADFLGRLNITFVVEVDCHLDMPTIANCETVVRRDRPLFIAFFETIAEPQDTDGFRCFYIKRLWRNVLSDSL